MYVRAAPGKLAATGPPLQEVVVHDLRRSVALIVIGAILRFAISYSPASVNLQLIGVILMIAGAVGLVVSLVWMFGRRRRTVTTARTPNTTEVYEECRYTEPPL